MDGKLPSARQVIEGAGQAYRRTVPDAPDWGEVVLVCAIAVAAALLLHWIVFRLASRLTARTPSQADDVLIRRLANPARVAASVIALAYAAQSYPVLDAIWQQIGGFVMPLLLGWLGIAIMRAFIEAMSIHADISVADNLRARRRRTRLAVLGRIATFIIVFVVAALMMLSIPGVRDIGMTLIASAGLAGLALGAAAQPALRSLIAGTQMALTEPINIDDVVIVEGEWGRIEDIRTTYVVVRIWDDRRLVVPTTYFLEKPFQNWTKTTSELLGTVTLQLDPAARVGPLRQEFERLVRENSKWDGRVGKLQVTETAAEAKEVRLLVSARDASLLFDLRCDLREALLEWLADNEPEAFPRTRLEAARQRAKMSATPDPATSHETPSREPAP